MWTLARDGVSREVSCSALKGETVPDWGGPGAGTFRGWGAGLAGGPGPSFR